MHNSRRKAHNTAPQRDTSQSKVTHAATAPSTGEFMHLGTQPSSHFNRRRKKDTANYQMSSRVLLKTGQEKTLFFCLAHAYKRTQTIVSLRPIPGHPLQVEDDSQFPLGALLAVVFQVRRLIVSLSSKKAVKASPAKI